MPKTLLLLLLTTLLFPNSIYAASLSTEYTEQSHIIRQVLQVSPKIQASKYQVIQAEASVEALEAMLRPQLVATADHTRQNALNTASMFSMFDPNFDPDEIRSSSTVALTFAQQLGASNQLRAGLDKAEIGEALSKLQQEQTISEVLVGTNQAYYGFLRAYQGLELARLAYRHGEEELAITRQKQAAGTATPLDVLRRQNELSEAQNSVAQAETGFRLALLNLAQLLDEQPPLLAEGEAWAEVLLANEQQEVDLWDISLAEALDEGMKNRIELELLAKQRELARIDLKEKQQARDWTVDVQGRYVKDDWILQSSVDTERSFSTTVVRNFPDDNEDDFDLAEQIGRIGASGESSDSADELDSNPWQVTLGVNWQFGDGGASKAEEKRLEAAFLETEAQFKQARDGIYLEIHSLWEQTRQAERSLGLSRQRLEEARETYQQLETLFELGTVTQTQLLEGQLLLQQAINGINEARWDYQQNKLELGVAIGLSSQQLISGFLQ